MHDIKEWIAYDPESGIFTWVQSRSRRVKIGDVAGCINNRGYIQIRYSGKKYSAHRLAVYFVTGAFPDEVIDHINGIKSDNRYCNLRCVDIRTNSENRITPNKSNTHGFMGVTPHGKKWVARIMHDGYKKYIGVYNTPEAAHAAYLEAKRQMHQGWTI